MGTSARCSPPRPRDRSWSLAPPRSTAPRSPLTPSARSRQLAPPHSAAARVRRARGVTGKEAHQSSRTLSTSLSENVNDQPVGWKHSEKSHSAQNTEKTKIIVPLRRFFLHTFLEFSKAILVWG